MTREQRLAELEELRAELARVEQQLAEAQVAPVWATGPGRRTGRLECRRELYAALVRRRERELADRPQAYPQPVDKGRLAS